MMNKEKYGIATVPHAVALLMECEGAVAASELAEALKPLGVKVYEVHMANSRGELNLKTPKAFFLESGLYEWAVKNNIISEPQSTTAFLEDVLSTEGDSLPGEGVKPIYDKIRELLVLLNEYDK
jgi:predicted nuclease with RNAse H fold